MITDADEITELGLFWIAQEQDENSRYAAAFLRSGVLEAWPMPKTFESADGYSCAKCGSLLHNAGSCPGRP